VKAVDGIRADQGRRDLNYVGTRTHGDLQVFVEVLE